MPRFEPFAGLRFDHQRFDPALVTAPPYDVLDEDDRAALAALDPHNVVEIDLPRGDDPYGSAARTLRTWRDDGTFVQDDPCFYVYRMGFVDETGTERHTTGVLGALELSRPGEGGILPHEETTPKAKSDRLDLIRATGANLSAVWGLSPAHGLTQLLVTDADPLADFVDPDGVRHTFWRLDDTAQAEKISSLVEEVPVVIADGHHRFETSLAHRDERHAAGDGEGAWDALLTYLVELADDQLTVGPIHRLLDGLPDGFDLVAALEPYFEQTVAGPVDPGITRTMASQECLVLVEPDRTSFLLPRPGAFAGVRDLDTVRLDVALAGLPDHELRFQHGVEHVAAAVRAGRAQAGVLVRPATVGQILDIAHGGDRMPPKTTFFMPKPRTGLVIRPLD